MGNVLTKCLYWENCNMSPLSIHLLSNWFSNYILAFNSVTDHFYSTMIPSLIESVQNSIKYVRESYMAFSRGEMSLIYNVKMRG